ncbi:hypothetical protein A3A99_03885 [Candidatus Nomurabacteria bacterium RIFCSPLOWO2_01_FULL_41_18]|nr:MAG: hypothetical protein A3A99_03885 [Candidatus Nomurabacteria bacterium RIFCSPLOWO2_01_FULL_41_18]
MECPFCKQRMQVTKIENVWVDICKEHGVWLDKGEIDALHEAAKDRGKLEGFSDGLWNSTHD